MWDVYMLECNTHELGEILDNQHLFWLSDIYLQMNFCVYHLVHLFSGKEEEIQTKNNRKITDQPGVMPMEEEGLKN